MKQQTDSAAPQIAETPTLEQMQQVFLDQNSIFVVVLVNYDYYRFQDNLGASTSIEKAREIAAQKAKEYGYDGDLPVIEDAEKSSDMDSSETGHVWIEIFLQENSSNE